MIYATLNGTKIPAAPGMPTLSCPVCGGQVRPKCGRIVIWHWAHLAGSDCDAWSERDSEWHLAWQSTVPIERREIVIGNHRADLLTANGNVVELQHSHLSVAEIQEREAFYGPRMIWVFDAVEAFEQGRIDLRRKSQDVFTFRWKHPRKSIAVCQRSVLLDLGSRGLLNIGRFYPTAPSGGWGKLHSRADIIAGFNA
jgi:competence protein CoiA